MAGNSLIGNLAILLTMDTAAFEKGNSHAQKLLKSTQRQFENVAKKVYGVGQALTVGVTAPLVAFGTVAVREATEAAKAMGQVNAVLASMGPTAGKTADQLKKAADAFETKSLFEADEILTKLTANLLTFGNVAGEQFDRAQQAAINMSARLGQDLQSSAIQVGKALNDPIKGMTALTRVGVQFTAAQKEQIKALVESGQVAKAQGIILTELERQFAGAAEAAQNTDPFNKAADAFRQMAEQVGTALLPVIPVFTDAIVKLANAFSSLSPETQKWVIIAAAVGAALGPMLVGLAGLISSVGILLPLIIKLGPAFVVLGKGIAAARLAALAFLPALIPILVPLGLVAIAVGAVYLAYKNWDKIEPIVKRMAAGVEGHINRLKGILSALLAPITTVTNAFRTMYDRVVGHSYVPDMVDEIGAQMARLDAVMVEPVKAATTKAAEAFRNLQTETSNLLNRLFPEAAALNTFKNEIATLEDAMRKGILTADQYAAALQRLKTEGLTDEGIGVLDQGSLVPGDEEVLAGIEKAQEKMGEVVDRSKDWQNVISQVATDLANIGGDFLSRLVEGSVKLKDLWRTVLSYAIQFFTSSNSPFMSLFDGARAMGGPVQRGRTYLVGEEGPELFTANASGQIISNDNLRGASSGNVWNIYTNDADSFRRSQRQIAREQRRRLGVA
jgi:phage-related minor tail protein